MPRLGPHSPVMSPLNPGIGPTGLFPPLSVLRRTAPGPKMGRTFLFLFVVNESEPYKDTGPNLMSLLLVGNLSFVDTSPPAQLLNLRTRQRLRKLSPSHTFRLRRKLP